MLGRRRTSLAAGDGTRREKSMRRKLILFTLTTFAFAMVYLLVNLLHFRFFTVRVVLYDALLDIILAAAIVSPLYVGPTLSVLTSFESLLSFAFAALLCAFYALMFPTIIDRSLSVYMLEKLYQRGGAIALRSWDDILKKEFIPEHKLIEARLTEQLNSGTIVIDNDCVRLTEKGRLLVQFTKRYRQQFLPRKREIMGHYSDDLINTQAHGTVVVSCRCYE